MITLRLVDTVRVICSTASSRRKRLFPSFCDICKRPVALDLVNLLSVESTLVRNLVLASPSFLL